MSDTANLDFTTIPDWGEDDSHLENHWSGTRQKALSSMLAIFAHEPQSGIITYGDTSVRHQNKDKVVGLRVAIAQKVPLSLKLSHSKALEIDFS